MVESIKTSTDPWSIRDFRLMDVHGPVLKEILA